MARRPTCSPRHRVHCSRAHVELVDGYRAARDAVLALRESGTVAPAGFGHGAQVSHYQLEGTDRAPLPTFKAWLIDHRRGES